MIYNRYLRMPARGALHLRLALEGLTTAVQRDLAEEELRRAEAGAAAADQRG
jgi:hypothetical protein